MNIIFLVEIVLLLNQNYLKSVGKKKKKNRFYFIFILWKGQKTSNKVYLPCEGSQPPCSHIFTSKAPWPVWKTLVLDIKDSNKNFKLPYFYYLYFYVPYLNLGTKSICFWGQSESITVVLYKSKRKRTWKENFAHHLV